VSSRGHRQRARSRLVCLPIGDDSVGPAPIRQWRRGEGLVEAAGVVALDAQRASISFRAALSAFQCWIATSPLGLIFQVFDGVSRPASGTLSRRWPLTVMPSGSGPAS